MKSILLVALLSLAASFAYGVERTSLVEELRGSDVVSYACQMKINYLKINDKSKRADVVKTEYIWVNVLSKSMERDVVKLKCANKFNPSYTSLAVDGVERVMLLRKENTNLFFGMGQEIQYAEILAIAVL